MSLKLLAGLALTPTGRKANIFANSPRKGLTFPLIQDCTGLARNSYREWDQYNRKQWILVSFCISDQCEHFCKLHNDPLLLILLPVPVRCQWNHKWKRNAVQPRIRARLRFRLSQQMGCTGFNGSVHTMRLRQHHQLLYSRLLAKINRSRKSQIAQCDQAFICQHVLQMRPLKM